MRMKTGMNMSNTVTAILMMGTRYKLQHLQVTTAWSDSRHPHCLFSAHIKIRYINNPSVFAVYVGFVSGSVVEVLILEFYCCADISLDLDFGGMKKKKKKKKAFDMDDVGEALPVSVSIYVLNLLE